MVNWNSPIQFFGFEPEDLPAQVHDVNSEDGWVEVEMMFDASTSGTTHGIFYDTIVVDYTTGAPLNPFVSDEFRVVNSLDYVALS